MGIELARLAPEVANGFLALLVPMLRAELGERLQVFVREKEEVRTDIRLSVLRPGARPARQRAAAPSGAALGPARGAAGAGSPRRSSSARGVRVHRNSLGMAEPPPSPLAGSGR